MSHTDVDINFAEAFSPAKGIAGVKTFINNFAYIFAIMIVMLIMIVAIAGGWITTTVKSRFSGPDMWSAGNAMQYQCIDLAGQSHCGPGGGDDDDNFRGGRERAGAPSMNKAVNQRRVTTVKPTASRFLNVRSNGNDPAGSQQVLDYYNQQIATGDNYTYTGGDTGTGAAVANANAAVAAAANASAAANAANTAANAAIAAANTNPGITTAPAVATTTTVPTTSYFSGGKKVTDEHLTRAIYGG